MERLTEYKKELIIPNMFVPTIELGETVYIVENGHIYKGIVYSVSLVKVPYRDEYGNMYFEKNRNYCKPKFIEKVEIGEVLIENKNNYSTFERTIDHVWTTVEDSGIWLMNEEIKKYKK